MSEALEQAVACHRRGDLAAARTAAETGLRTRPDDPSLLHFLGMLESGAGDYERAEAHLRRANNVAPDNVPIRVSLARVLYRAGRWEALAALPPAGAGPLGDELLQLRTEALQNLGRPLEAAHLWQERAGRANGGAGLWVAAARAFADAGEFGDAERAYRAALAADPASQDALLGIAGLLESLNRLDELAPVFDAAAAAGARAEVIGFGEALRQRETGDFNGALSALTSAEPILPAGTYHQMRGDLLDRLGEIEGAFAAFRAMNQADAALAPALQQEASAYRADLAKQVREASEVRTAAPPDDRLPPAFLVSFPRSGTTLLDTFLMGHPQVQVHEERPFLGAAFTGLSASAAEWTREQLVEARERYRQALDRESTAANLLHIDKSPLASGGAHLVHRLFPDAPFVFALRHPCDVVLSCFITRFRLNRGVASFLDLRSAAEQYDLVMQVWTVAREALGLRVHEVRYEQLVSQPERELRAVTEFLQLPFEPQMLDHRRTARERGMISTPSHAQVAAPLSLRPSGRWRRYREHLGEILPVLKPWCDHFGYALDPESTAR